MTANIQELENALIQADAAGDQQSVGILVGEIERLQSLSQQSPAAPQESSVMRDYVAPAVRGLAPTAIGAGIGAVAGIPAGPGGIAAGARYGAAAAEVGTLGGDFAALAINKMLGTRFETATDAWNGLFDRAGLPKSETAGQKMVESGARAVGSTLGTMGLGKLMSAFGSGKVASVGQILSAAPREQLAAAAVGGAAGEGARGAVEDLGGGEGAQLAASLLAGVGAGMTAGRLAGFNVAAKPAANEAIEAARYLKLDELPTSVVMPPTTLPGKYMQTLGANIPLVGTSKRYEKLGSGISESMTSLLGDYGVIHGADAPIARDVVENLIATRGKNIADLVDQKRSVINPLVGKGPVPLNNTIAEIDAQILQLNKINPEAYAPAIQKLESFKNNIQGKTLDLIEENRKVLRGFKADPNLATIKDAADKAINSTYSALRSDMGRFIESQAGAAAKAKWNIADANLAGMIDDLNVNSFKSALKDTAMSPQKVATMLRSKDGAEIEVLLQNTDAKGKFLLKSALLQDLANRSDVNGTISQQKFLTNLNKFSANIKKVFEPVELERINAITKVLEATPFVRNFAPDAPTGIKGVVPQSAVLMGATAAGVLGKGVLIGAGWNLYESKVMRDLLLRISRNPKEERELIKRASTMLQVGYAKTIGKEMIQKGVPITFAPDSMKQEQVGKGSVSTDMAHGYRIVSTDGKKHRLYGPDNQLVGVFKSLDDARIFADNKVVNRIKIPTK